MSDEKIKQAMAFSLGSKSLIVAYLLWFFLGFLGAHRMYLSKVGTGVCMLLLTLIGFATLAMVIGGILLFIVFIWWIIDAILIYTNTRKHNKVYNSLKS